MGTAMLTLSMRCHSAISEIDESAWQALLGADDNPFVSHAFLQALESSGTIRADYGWRAAHLALYQEDGVLVGACPLYIKNNSHGEFVFDWGWAQAYAQHGLDYYPKLLGGVPYSPVTGPRLLAREDRIKTALVQALQRFCLSADYSSAHLNFLQPADLRELAAQGWLTRTDIQFHWHNPGNWQTFSDFLAAMQAKKRKNILQERAKVARLGLRIEARDGRAIDAALWQDIHALYQATFDMKGNTAALTAQFFIDYCAKQAAQIVVFLAFDAADRLVAMALCFRSEKTLYGRYWGCSEELPGLHFECCYYQGIEYCLAQGLSHFEPGAQGEHKLARGFLPTEVHSAHFIADARFRDAIARSVSIECQHRARYREELLAHSPFLQDSLRFT
jgi:uncharacterized protein